MGRKKRRKNATFKKQWYKLLDDHWDRERKMRMKQILGQDPNTVKPVTGTIDGRDWKTYFPQPLKQSGFSWSEFARRVETLQDEKNKAQDKEHEKMKDALRSKYIKTDKPKDIKHKKDNDVVMSNNPYKTVNNDLEDSDDEKW
mmetsp:Transcript_27829/g.24620  ORF Transcript_27829/g.24620 Transcript_27829/m.24620 type:complete len:143 (+) Transcript_27829:71-499(+)|eukprot:CAMPEP_0201581050 /NCGR_PEP_ID=MMETSP0190_2-20130828/61748_1 /ASSEMBLY_ACC=CAM_ASM_000263 /TAXON_ID=37353 /ORGANISM="Rosalina sp." /LENGTH=142 /DNA_ID=CAMNT_0048018251 /DNA_START=71 /DNA_END=496 /DNA_ORIENTATION=+